MATAFVLLSLILVFKGQQKEFRILKSRPGLLLITALCLAANYLGYMKAVELTSPANTQIFIQLGPLLLALSGVLFFKETLGRWQIFGISLCALGFGLFFYEKLTHLPTDSGTYMLGQAWVVMAALTWAIFAGLQKVVLKKWSSNAINLYIYLVAILVFTPMVDWGRLAAAPIQGHALFFFLGFNTLLAYGGLSLALKHLPATQVSPLITLNPLVTLALLYGMEAAQWTLIPPDPISPSGYVGAFLAILGVVFIVSRHRR